MRSLLWILLFLAQPLAAQSVVLNEIMPANGSTLADEDGDFEDWIELYNAGETSTDLTGWALSDDSTAPAKWIFPATEIPAGGYLGVWASGKDRRVAGGPLHTNFRLPRSGRAVTLSRADGSPADQSPVLGLPFPTAPGDGESEAVGAMPTDVSVGRARHDPATWVHFAAPTPGWANADASGHLLLEQVEFSLTSRTFSGNLTVALSGAGPGQSIRFTQDGSEPAHGSQIYVAPISMTGTRTLRARVFDETGAAGRVTSHHFLRLHSDVAQRRSNLPMVVLDARGQTLNGVTRRDGFFHLFETDANGISAVARLPDLSTRQGLRWRGSTSENNPKKPYAVEFWNETNEDRDLNLLGMAADSDWVFYAPYHFDRAFIRNTVAFELSRRIGRWAPETRFVEVFLNANGTDLRAADYVGVYGIAERIKQGSHRLGVSNVNRRDVPPPGLIDVRATGPWTGGYIFKVDRSAADEYTWKTARNLPVRPLVLSRPKLDNLDGGPFATISAATLGSRQAEYIRTYTQAFEDALFLDLDSNFAERRHLDFIDRASWVDHLLVNAFTKNVDALRLSAFFHKPQNGPIFAGPVWDSDRSMDSYDIRDDSWDTWYGSGDATPYFNLDWWGVICQDIDFVQAFYDRWAEVRQEAYSDEALATLIVGLGEMIDNSANGLGSAAARDAVRWPTANSPRGGVYMNEIHHLRDWLVARAGWMDRRRLDGELLPGPPRVLAGSLGQIEFALPDTGSIYFTLDGTDPRAEGGGVRGHAYAAPVSINGPVSLVARIRDGDGNWSTPTRITLHPTSPDPDRDGMLIHYWSFNTESLAPTFTNGRGNLTILPAEGTEVLFGTGADFNALNQVGEDPAGSHLRINHPLGATVQLDLPTTGFAEPMLHYESRRSGQGAGEQQISYALDGESFTDWPHPVTVHNDAPNLYAFDFSTISGAEDNPLFTVRITFLQGAGGVEGNNRFDNITLRGQPIPGANLPPRVVHAPQLRKLIALDEPAELDLDAIFEDPNGDPLTFTATTPADWLTVEVDGAQLQMRASRAGDAIVTLTASDGVHPPVETQLRVLAFPAAHRLGVENFRFSAWSPGEPAGSFPPHMIFLQSTQDDPTLDTPLLHTYHIPAQDAAAPADVLYPYAATSRTRINGLGDHGISFINTGRGRDLGAALLALDTRGAEEIDVSWLAGTILANTRIYALRLQYRTGPGGAWNDLEHNGQPVEYDRGPDGDEQAIGPVRLPADLHNRPHVQLRWLYHHVDGSSGQRAQLRLDDVLVTATRKASFDRWRAEAFPAPEDRANPAISGPLAEPHGDGVPNLLRYALGLRLDQPALDHLPRAGVEDNFLALRFHFNDSLTDIAYIVEASDDLHEWPEILYDSRDGLPAEREGEIAIVTDSTPVSSHASRFLRLRVILLSEN
jgi:hypothetical protein